MIPMTCPQCGRRGNVPPDRINTRMHCKKCDAVFFMDKSGKIVMGDPSQIAARKNKDPKQAAARKRAEYETPSFGALIMGLPTPVKVVALVALLGVLAYASGFHKRFRFGGGGGIPKSLLGRAEYAANAFADNLPDKLKPIITPGDDAVLQQWFEALRPGFHFQGPQNESTGNVVLMTVTPIKDDLTEAHYVLHIFYPSVTPHPEVKEQMDARPRDRKRHTDAGYKADGAYDVPTFWTKPADAWLLDVKKSLEAAKDTGAKKK